MCVKCFLESGLFPSSKASVLDMTQTTGLGVCYCFKRGVENSDFVFLFSTNLDVAKFSRAATNTHFHTG